MSDVVWLGPVVALLAVGLLAVILRWAFGSTELPGPSPDGPSNDFGLLHEIAVVRSATEATALRALLADEGIRSTTAAAGRGRVRVLVFATDVDRARRLVGPGANS